MHTRMNRAARVLSLGLAGAALAAAPGCVAVIGFDGHAAYRADDRVEAELTCSLTPANDARVLLDVEARNGGISVERYEGKSVEVLASFKALNEERAAGVGVKLHHDENTGVLLVRPVWPDGGPKNARGKSEGVSFAIRVPRTDGVRLESKNGALRIKRLGGEARLHTDNGAITVEHHAGPVTAHTSNGRIEVDGVDGAVDLESSNGAIEIENAGGAVKAHTSNGKIEAELASGSPGPVDLRTSNGRVELEVGRAFAGSIEYGLDLGSIELRGFPEGSVERRGPRAGTVRAGDGPESTVRTSLGSIRIERAN